MRPSIADLLPSITALSPNDKFRLVQVLLAQIAAKNGIETIETPPKRPPVSHQKSLRGCLKNHAQPNLITQEQDVWQTVMGKKYEHR
ncbi:MAG: hypothetical protein ACPGVO_20340 [Spirulinaceae cyanobacterium]